MKKLLLLCTLFFLSLSAQAADKWHYGLEAGYKGSDDQQPYEYIDEFHVNLYLTHSSDLEVSYRLGIGNRTFPDISSGGLTLLIAGVLYNAVQTDNGWFIDLEAALTQPLSDSTSSLDANTYEQQTDTGFQYGIGFGKTIGKSWSVRATFTTDQGTSLYRNGSSLIDSYLSPGLGLMYMW